MIGKSTRLGLAASMGVALAAGLFAKSRTSGRASTPSRPQSWTGNKDFGSTQRRIEDRERSRTSDDIMGISHGGGRDQYGGSFGSGQSGGGAYANPHTGSGGGQGGNRVSGDRGDALNTGGQTSQGYYGGGQMGDRNYDKGDSHNAASTAGGPGGGERTYQDHPSQRGEDVDDALAKRLEGTGFNEHEGFGASRIGQMAQGIEHGGPHLPPDPEPGRRD